MLDPAGYLTDVITGSPARLTPGVIRASLMVVEWVGAPQNPKVGNGEYLMVLGPFPSAARGLPMCQTR